LWLSHNLDRAGSFSDRPDHRLSRLHQEDTLISLFNNPARAFSQVSEQSRSPLDRRHSHRHLVDAVQQSDYRRNAQIHLACPIRKEGRDFLIDS
jgi:hypothetical protein